MLSLLLLLLLFSFDYLFITVSGETDRRQAVGNSRTSECPFSVIKIDCAT